MSRMGQAMVLGLGLLTLGVWQRGTALGRYRSGIRAPRRPGLGGCRPSWMALLQRQLCSLEIELVHRYRLST